MIDVDAIMSLAPVIPVLIIDDVAHARPLAEALVAGGLPALEVTLRTPVALEAIREMAKVAGAVVGAGTVLNERDLETSVQAGARFIVSPALTEPLSKRAVASGIPFLPGIATAGEPPPVGLYQRGNPLSSERLPGAHASRGRTARAQARGPLGRQVGWNLVGRSRLPPRPQANSTMNPGIVNQLPRPVRAQRTDTGTMGIDNTARRSRAAVPSTPEAPGKPGSARSSRPTSAGCPRSGSPPG